MAFENLLSQFSAPGAELAKAPGDYMQNILRAAQAQHAREQDARNKQLLPYLLQQYKDLHAGRMDSNALAHINRMIAEAQYHQLMGNKPANESTQQPSSNMDSLSNIMQPIFTPKNIGVNPQSKPIQGMEASLQEQLGGQHPEEMFSGQQVTEQNQEQPQQSTENVSQMPGVAGQEQKEVVLRQSRPGFELRDKFAGSGLGLGKNDKIQTVNKNGWIYSMYPGGKITAIKDPTATTETPEAKRKGELESKLEYVHERDKDKRISENESTSKDVFKLLKNLNTLDNILMEKPDLTGPTMPIRKKIGMISDEDVGRFNDAALDIQTKRTKELSTRGGYGAALIVQSGKPSIGNSGAENIGFVKSLKEKAIDSFMQLKDEYEKDHSGKKYPYKLSDYIDSIIIRRPDGVIKRYKTNVGLKLLEDHPQSKVVG